MARAMPSVLGDPVSGRRTRKRSTSLQGLRTQFRYQHFNQVEGQSAYVIRGCAKHQVCVLGRVSIMSYQGPMLIREPELRWPIVMLAALITAAIALLAAGMIYVAMTQPIVNHYAEPGLESALHTGQPEFEQFREQIVIEQQVGKEKVHPFNNLAVEITAIVRNNTGRNISGLEMRGAVLDTQNSTVRERTVVVIPARQTVLEADEAINVRILLESINKDSDRAHLVLEVTGIRFWVIVMVHEQFRLDYTLLSGQQTRLLQALVGWPRRSEKRRC